MDLGDRDRCGGKQMQTLNCCSLQTSLACNNFPYLSRSQDPLGARWELPNIC